MRAALCRAGFPAHETTRWYLHLCLGGNHYATYDLRHASCIRREAVRLGKPLQLRFFGPSATFFFFVDAFNRLEATSLVNSDKVKYARR
jgi:hypothetical protein